MKYIPFVVRMMAIAFASVIIAKNMEISFGSVFRHLVWIGLTVAVYFLFSGAHVALDDFMIRRQDKKRSKSR